MPDQYGLTLRCTKTAEGWKSSLEVDEPHVVMDLSCEEYEEFYKYAEEALDVHTGYLSMCVEMSGIEPSSSRAVGSRSGMSVSEPETP